MNISPQTVASPDPAATPLTNEQIDDLYCYVFEHGVITDNDNRFSLAVAQTEEEIAYFSGIPDYYIVFINEERWPVAAAAPMENLFHLLGNGINTMTTVKTASRALLSDLKEGRDPAIAFDDALKDLNGHDRDTLRLCRSEMDGTISPRFVEMQVRERMEYVVTVHLPNGEDVVTRYPSRLQSEALLMLENYYINGDSATLTIE